jgi:glucose-1-phosphate thymidylyltransferase
MKALILAAGYATRLYPLTKEYPKPLLTVGKRPLINYIVEKLGEVPAIDEILVVTNSKFIGHFQKWARTVRSRKELTLVDDLTKELRDKRGAIGDIHFAIEDRCIRDDLLVIGGDNLFDEKLKKFVLCARKHAPHPTIGVYDVGAAGEAHNFGVVKCDARGHVVDFKEKPARPESSLIAMCLYFFPRQKVGLVKEYMRSRCQKADATGSYIAWLVKKQEVYAYTFGGRWFDIGHRQIYNTVKERYNIKK